MLFVDYKLLSNKYQDGQMAESIQILEEFDVFHCLLAGSSDVANAAKKRIPDLPDDFFAWLEVCDGGLLFDTHMLTSKKRKDELGAEFYTFKDFANDELRQEFNLSSDWFVFAVAVHSDVFFFDTSKKDGKVYQWDVEEDVLYMEWNSFADWLSDQIHEAVEEIANENLMPLSIKMGMTDE
jgi:hypothetical protein